MWSIRQTDAGWDVLDATGVVLHSALATYSDALGHLATYARLALAADTAAPNPPAGLARPWSSGDSGMVLAEPTGDGRDFTGCTFTWRPLSEYPLPLMLQTVNDFGHMGAELCGWYDRIALRTDGGVDAGGWFHDTDAGRQAYAILEAQGRMGISADPGPGTAYTETCLEYEEDEFGTFCVDSLATFTDYEVIGGTLTPFPGFGKAWVQLGDAPAPAAAEPAGVAAAAAVLELASARPPAERFTMEEPPDDDERYVDQGHGRLAVPLTITADGHVYGHGAVWGTCHIGYQGVCITPPESPTNCARFNLGETLAADGSRHFTGTLVLGLDHAGHQLAAPAATDHYAHTGMAWADVHMSNGRHGYWLSGQLRATVTPALEAVLRGSCLSGDWRTFTEGLDLVGFQAVNVPGFPIARQALAAAATELGQATLTLASPVLVAQHRGGVLVGLAAAGIVRPARAHLEALAASGALECAACPPGAPLTLQDVLDMLGPMAGQLAALESRTRHLIGAERDHLRAQLVRTR